jgi:hypothetical protein
MPARRDEIYIENVEFWMEVIHPSPFRLSVKSLESFMFGVLKLD